MGSSHAYGVQLRTVAFYPATDRFGHEIFDLLTADLHIRQPLTGQQQLGGESIGFFSPGFGKAAAALTVGQCGIGDLHPLLGGHQLIGRKSDGKAIEQVIANVAFFGVVGGD